MAYPLDQFSSDLQDYLRRPLPLLETSGTIAAAAGAGTRYSQSSGVTVVSGSGAAAGVPQFTLSGRSDISVSQLNLYVSLTTTVTQTGVNFTFGLYPVTISGTTTTVYTLGTVVSGSTVAFAAPAANAELRGNSGDFTTPADDLYVIGVVTDASTAAASNTSFHAILRSRAGI